MNKNITNNLLLIILITFTSCRFSPENKKEVIKSEKKTDINFYKQEDTLPSTGNNIGTNDIQSWMNLDSEKLKTQLRAAGIQLSEASIHNGSESYFRNYESNQIIYFASNSKNRVRAIVSLPIPNDKLTFSGSYKCSHKEHDNVIAIHANENGIDKEFQATKAWSIDMIKGTVKEIATNKVYCKSWL